MQRQEEVGSCKCRLLRSAKRLGLREHLTTFTCQRHRMSEPTGNHPDSGRVDLTPQGDAIVVFTPCCGTRVLFPTDRAVAGAEMEVVCPSDGEARLVELADDGTAESGLRAVWAEATPQPDVEDAEGRGGDLGYGGGDAGGGGQRCADLFHAVPQPAGPPGRRGAAGGR